MLNCEFYEQREMGLLNEGAFVRHAQECPACQKILRQDAHVLALMRSEQQPATSPLLWAKIENALRTEKRRSAFRQSAFWRAPGFTRLRWAAVLLLGLGLGSYVLLKSKPQTVSSRLLTEEALQQVALKEQEYLHAIAQLEQAAAPQLAAVDVDLMLLYRDRLETIDAQIKRCQEALARNPANAHLRRYLLAALQDKQETLQELVKRTG